jgi:hypothetical protein
MRLNQALDAPLRGADDHASQRWLVTSEARSTAGTA